MTIRLYNTLTREKQDFVPIDPERVTMYVCGPTVYNFAHIGNARPAVIFDVLYRLLALHYKQVIYARNITDVDDKINAKAAELKVPIKEISYVLCGRLSLGYGSHRCRTPHHRATRHRPH